MPSSLSGAPRADAGRRRRQRRPRATECPARVPGQANRTGARAAALDAAAAGVPAIVVNIPEFRARAMRVRDGKVEMKVAMNVIVGNAAKTRTPIFDAEMRFVEFSQPVLERPAVDRQRRDTAEAAPRAGLFRPAGIRIRRPRRQGCRRLFPRPAWTRSSAEKCASASGRAPERARRHQVRLPQPGQYLPAPHADPNSSARPPRLQPRVHPRRGAGGAGEIRPRRRAGLDRGAHRSGNDQGKVGDAAPAEPSRWSLPTPPPSSGDGRIHFPDIYGHDKILDDALRQRSQP